jgi:hypothetical protein
MVIAEFSAMLRDRERVLAAPGTGDRRAGVGRGTGAAFCARPEDRRTGPLPRCCGWEH